MGMSWVDANAFREGLAPLTSGIRDFAFAATDVGTRHGRLAWDESPAMRELASQTTYANRSGGWEAPFDDTHHLAALTLRAAADYAHTFADALNADRAPVYGHLVLSRAALESSVVSWWLSEGGISHDERVKRGLSEYAFSALEQDWSGLTVSTGRTAQVWLGYAESLKWSVTDANAKAWGKRSRGKPRIDGVSRPSIPAALNKLLLDTETGRIGRAQWSGLSAVSHVTFFGLQWAFLPEDAQPSALGRDAIVPIGTNSTTVYLQAVCLLRALRKAADSHFALMGWRDQMWVSASKRAELLERGVLDAVNSVQD